MYLLYYMQQDYDNVELFHIGLFENEDAAEKHKQKMLDESAKNKKSNEEQAALHQIERHKKIREFSALARAYLERNKRAIQSKSFNGYNKDPIFFLSGGDISSSYYGTERRFLTKSREYWDRDLFWSEYLDLSKVDSDPEFIDDDYPASPVFKPIYHENCFHIERVNTL